jgi:serine/threonine-protein phosphatase 2B regulatory subunit
MVLATLTESDVTVPNDIVESIVEKVLNFIQPYTYPPSNSIYFFNLILISYFSLLDHFQTMKEVDLKGDGKIDMEEWKEYASKTPSLLKIMTLPYLK